MNLPIFNRTLLFLTAEHLQVYAWNGDELTEEHCLEDNEGGRERLADYLQQHPEPAYFLVDVVEEDFRHELVPHLFGRAHRELIARKFEHYYRNTPFHQAKTLRRQSEGRRDDEIRLSALTNPQHISLWLDVLLENHTPLRGIYSVPDICPAILGNTDSGHVLLLSWEKQAGLRQTYLHQKQPHLSRLTSVENHSSFSAAVINETPHIQHYLASLNLPPQGETLNIYIICHTHDHENLNAQLQNNSNTRYVYLDIQTLGNNLRSQEAPQDSDATSLFLRLLAHGTPVSQYANTRHTHYYHLWKLRLTLWLCTVCLFLSALLWSGISVHQGLAYTTASSPLNLEAQQLNDQTEKLRQKSHITATTSSDMKAAVTLARELDKSFPAPEEILLKLSRVLDEYTRVRAHKIAWHRTETDFQSGTIQQIDFEGELLDFGRDYRAALAYMENFEQALRQQGYDVSAQTAPLDISPQGNVTNDLQDTPAAAKFTLKILWDSRQ